MGGTPGDDRQEFNYKDNLPHVICANQMIDIDWKTCIIAGSLQGASRNAQT